MGEATTIIAIPAKEENKGNPASDFDVAPPENGGV
jgi:hypothetical protein